VFRKECKTLLLDSHTITTVGIRANKYYGAGPIRAQASRIYLWFVVNRVAYGEGLRLFLCFVNKNHEDEKEFTTYPINITANVGKRL
jgi:hypothetical protein